MSMINDRYALFDNRRSGGMADVYEAIDMKEGLGWGEQSTGTMIIDGDLARAGGRGKGNNSPAL